MTTALYRRYRPETFAEVIGQDHVTAPLRQALRSGQVNHAYLFSGPRGCGKTTSARILARILNCARNTEASPTDTPCGECESCVELARGGPGSLDVVEIDAASHGGVDDARELRERATFAPARDRFKVFILDEAHMVSNQGFNALLKIVEEPPPHVKFIFATTEPDKVIGTIRSRTHHYPFRLVPPDVLVPYLEQLCATEGVQVGSGVLPLVVRAGGGSVRDTLSVLDQLIAGAGDDGIHYEGAAALLGYTQASLLDDLVEAVAARDGAAAFRVVERVISTGHEPRRFVEDLLERLRDLIVISASGDAADAVLRHVPADQLERMRQQARHLGASELSRSADLANAALTEMTGATSPRLHLELLMARLLLPAADDSRSGLGARLDRLERGVPAGAGAATAEADEALRGGSSAASEPSGASAAQARAALAAAAAERASAPLPVPVVPAGTDADAERGADADVAGDADTDAGADTDGTDTDGGAGTDGADTDGIDGDADAEIGSAIDGDAAPGSGFVAGSAVVEPAAVAPAVAAGAAPAGAPVDDVEPDVPVTAPVAVPAAGGQTEVLRRRWPEVLETVKGLRRVTWALVGPDNAQVAELDATTLRLAFGNANLAATFRNGGHSDVVSRAVRETLGFDVRVEPVVGDAPVAAPRPSGGEAAGRPGTETPGAAAPRPASTASSGRAPGGRPAASAAAEDDVPWDEPEPPDPGADASEPTFPGGEPVGDPAEPPRAPSARERAVAAARASAAAEKATARYEDDEPSPDDPDITSSGLVGAPLIAQMLGGTVIDEQLDEPRP
ncbi:DNA polymerase III subunit gamma and tau [Cellulomonas alba]|uniref:DNA polymerase III subunit gamma/tau n=1 Tax=Cellulomonas alba TaxID=3053467 RepID=A0ABT7SEX9_9CELL|nr:DNA polymerase III subunit gamma and tau [Cellulomonas alba]MDM7854686.1 DNA polymerase III subunit gamma and tau [Cellulomonas alba]